MEIRELADDLQSLRSFYEMPQVCASWRPKKGQAPPKTSPLQPTAAPMWSPDSNWLLVPCQGWGAVVFNTFGGESGFLIQEDPRLGAVRFSWLPWGSIAAIHNLGVHIWSVERQRLVARWPVARQLMCSKRYAAVLQANKISVYESDEKILFEVSSADFTEIAFHGDLLYGWEGAAHSGKLWIWDMQGEGRLADGLDPHHGYIKCVAEGAQVALLSPKGAVALWNSVLMQWHRLIELGISEEESTAVIYRERTVQTIEGAKTRYEICHGTPKEDAEPRGPSLISFSKDFLALKHSSFSNVVWIISLSTLSICACLQHTQPITSLHFNDANLLVICCATDQLFFWQPEGAHVIPLPEKIKAAHWINDTLLLETPTGHVSIAHPDF